MALARRQQISLEHTRYYHCMSRCVRQAFLCGQDARSGKNYSHRRQWLENRLELLAQVFAIDLLSYAIMSNHYHLVLFVNETAATKLTDEEVVQRWGKLFHVSQHSNDAAKILEWRKRLSSISWFMRCLNEPLARFANKEDDCKGRFWEGRFKLQALLDDSALLRCMCYVDLNPIRAKITRLPETSLHTSIRARIRGNDKHLASFRTTSSKSSAIPVSKVEYLRLVDCSGRMMRSKKAGYIPDMLPRILDRLDIKADAWRFDMLHYGRWYYRAVGSVAAMTKYCKHLGQKWLKGTQIAATRRRGVAPTT